MKIAFKIKGAKEFWTEDTEVQIIDRENNAVIGRIFSPAGTSRDVPNAIQICGFDFSYQLYGCGVIIGEDGLYKKDIQLLFSPREKKSIFSGHKFNDAHRCFNKEEDCTCDELKVFEDIEEVERFMEKREKKRLKGEILKKLE